MAKQSRILQNGHMALKNASHPKHLLTRKAPDNAICRARRDWIGDLVYCLVPVSIHCELRVNFGGTFFCCHPERKGIVTRTEAKGN